MEPDVYNCSYYYEINNLDVSDKLISRKKLCNFGDSGETTRIETNKSVF